MLVAPAAALVVVSPMEKLTVPVLFGRLRPRSDTTLEPGERGKNEAPGAVPLNDGWPVRVTIPGKVTSADPSVDVGAVF